MTGKAQHGGKWIDWEVPLHMGAEHIRALMSNTHVPQIILDDAGTYFVNTPGLFDRYKKDGKTVRNYTEFIL
jgi:hypothetical protein